MSAKLVVRAVVNGSFISSAFTEDDSRKKLDRLHQGKVDHQSAEALMMYRIHEGREAASVPWHSFGKGSKSLCVDEIHEYLDTSAPIQQIRPFYRVDEEVVLCSDEKAINWQIDLNGDGVRENYYLGTVGNETQMVNNFNFFDSFRTWEKEGFQMESAGYLAGGSRLWGQVDLRVNETDFEVRPGDKVLPYFFFAHAHDGTLALTGGMTMTRIVCNNTCSAALGGEVVKMKHMGNVEFKTQQIHKIHQGLIGRAKRQIEEFRQLDAKRLADDKEIYRFVNLIQGKGRDDDEGGKVHEDVAERFNRGIALRPMGSATYWDLLNVWTEMVSHHLGNEMKGETAGDRVARRLEASWFGSGARSNDKALNAALALAASA